MTEQELIANIIEELRAIRECIYLIAGVHYQSAIELSGDWYLREKEAEQRAHYLMRRIDEILQDRE